MIQAGQRVVLKSRPTTGRGVAERQLNDGRWLIELDVPQGARPRQVYAAEEAFMPDPEHT